MTDDSHDAQPDPPADPPADRSGNPAAGEQDVSDVPGVPDVAAEQRRLDALLGDAIAALTAAGRWRRRVVERATNGAGEVVWEPHPTKTEQSDWAELVALVVTSAAANLGGTERALAGRPGSWEADLVRSLVTGTAGEDPAELMRRRTEPLRVRIAAAGLLHDLMDTEALFDESHQILSDQLDAALERAQSEFDTSSHVWTYRPEQHQGVTTLVGIENEAPAFDETRWREDLAALGASAESVEVMVSQLADPAGLISQVSVSRDNTAREVLVDLETRRAAAVAPEEQRLADLEDLQDRERTEYADRLWEHLDQEASRLYPGVELRFEIDLDRYATDTHPDPLEDGDGNGTGDGSGYLNPEAELLQLAISATPLPGSGLTPLDYPPGDIGQHERTAGRLPHTRLP